MTLLAIKYLTDTAKAPTYGSDAAIGCDVYADLPEGDRLIQPGERMKIPSGIAICMPEGFYGRLAPRSGIADRDGIDVFAGVIDRDYRGEVQVLLFNSNYKPFLVRHGDRIAQLILERAERGDISVVDTLPDSKRGSGGFGSTGI